MNKTVYFGNPWIGMFIKANDTVSILPIDSMSKLDDIVKENLKTDITIKTTIGDSNLLGVYLAMNSNGIILPNIIRDEEIKEIRKTGMNIYVSKEQQNAHGNNITINDKGGIINPHIRTEERKAIGDVLGVELVPMMIAEYSTVGSCSIATNKGFLSHYKTSEQEMKELEDALKVKGSRGTVNMGTGFLSYGVVVNKNGYVAGENTTAFELGRIEEALDMIK